MTNCDTPLVKKLDGKGKKMERILSNKLFKKNGVLKHKLSQLKLLVQEAE